MRVNAHAQVILVRIYIALVQIIEYIMNVLVDYIKSRKMKVVYNNLIPFKGFQAMNLFGILFARKEYNPISKITLNHEAIHTA